MTTATTGSTTGGSEGHRRTTSRGRWLGLLVTIVLLGAIGLTLYDMAGQSDREKARLVGGVAEASTTVRDFGYVPTLIISSGAGTVRVTIHNQGVHSHTFTIDSLGVDQVIPRGETRVVTVHPLRGGPYLFYCRFHQSWGMRGHLVVEST